MIAYHFRYFSDQSLLDENKRLKISPNLELMGHSGVYAVGDCNSYPQEKMAPHAADHGELAANNIKAAILSSNQKDYVPSRVF